MTRHTRVVAIELEFDEFNPLNLELDDEEAVKHMQNVIDQSVTSFMARVAEFQHTIAQWAKS